MLAAGARPKETKINLMDCICLCSEVEMLLILGYWSCKMAVNITDYTSRSFDLKLSSPRLDQILPK